MTDPTPDTRVNRVEEAKRYLKHADKSDRVVFWLEDFSARLAAISVEISLGPLSDQARIIGLCDGSVDP